MRAGHKATGNRATEPQGYCQEAATKEAAATGGRQELLGDCSELLLGGCQELKGRAHYALVNVLYLLTTWLTVPRFPFAEIDAQEF